MILDRFWLGCWKFSRYNWPGNIRELQNFITRAFIVSKSKIIDTDTPGINIFSDHKPVDTRTFKIPDTWLEMDNLRREEADKAARNVEKLFLENLLNKFDGNISKAAEHIGINRSNLHKMINKCGL